MSIREESYPKDEGCSGALRALGMKPGVDSMSCSECPFPFCVVSESRRLRNLARNIMIVAMHNMHASVNVIAARVGVSAHTVYKVVREKDEEVRNCYWCKLDLREGGVFCRPSYCTVVYDNNDVAVTLSSHRRATDQEVNMIETLVGNMFPDGVIKNVNDSEHDHWIINMVEKDEASFVYNRMSELSTYTTALR